MGPYLYCNVLNLDDCQQPQAQGELAASERYPVQLSVPEAISRAPWRLLQVYEDPTNTATTMFRPGTRLAVTIPSVDPQRGRLTGIVVQLLTLVIDSSRRTARRPARGMVSAADFLAFWRRTSTFRADSRREMSPDNPTLEP